MEVPAGVCPTLDAKYRPKGNCIAVGRRSGDPEAPLMIQTWRGSVGAKEKFIRSGAKEVIMPAVTARLMRADSHGLSDEEMGRLAEFLEREIALIRVRAAGAVPEAFEPGTTLQ